MMDNTLSKGAPSDAPPWNNDTDAACPPKTLLFVDDEPLYLEMARDLFPMLRPEWTFHFASNGTQALELLDQAGATVLVTDYVMPGMTGLELLDKVRDQHPDTIRIVLSGLGESQRVLDAAGSGHEFLPKPCDPKLLFQTIERACYLRERVENPAVQRLVPQISSLPSLPGLYSELMAELNRDDASMERVGEILLQDLSMCAKVLHVVNLTAFGLGQQITDPQEAVVYLGTTALMSLVLSHQIFAHFNEGTSALSPQFLNGLWAHSQETAVCARVLCRAQRAPASLQSQAFSGGLLHDIGKLILAANFPGPFQQVLLLAREKHIPFWHAEWEVFDTTHAEVGAYLLALWSLPDPIVAAVHCHHMPANEPRFYWSRTFSPVTATHVANALVHGGTTAGAEEINHLIDLRYLKQLELDDRIEAWQTDYQEAMSGNGA